MEQLSLPGVGLVRSFVLEGVTYSSQMRQCGKQVCKCFSGDPGDAHGPYWYMRDHAGAVRYVGRVLPGEVVRAWSVRLSRSVEIQQRLEGLYEDVRILELQMDALRLLQRGGVLSGTQRLWVDASGFADCLVMDDGGSGQQEQDILLAATHLTKEVLSPR